MLSKKMPIGLAAAAFTMLGAAANAQPAHHRHHVPTPKVEPGFYGERPPLTVTKRSFLDPGPVPALGSMQRYMTANTYYNRTSDQYFAKSQFGNEVLPQPFDVPGRPQPLFGDIWYANGVAP